MKRKKSKGPSPTARTLAALRAQDYMAQVVERWCPHSRRRIDLFGFVDVLAVSAEGETLAIQCTSSGGVAARRTKITEACDEAAQRILWAWNIQVWGWGKLADGRVRASRWSLREDGEEWVRLTDMDTKGRPL